jgi:hypothetical protein
MVVHLNRYEPDNELHRRNREWLAVHDGFKVTTSLSALADIVTGLVQGKL